MSQPKIKIGEDNENANLADETLESVEGQDKDAIPDFPAPDIYIPGGWFFNHQLAAIRDAADAASELISNSMLIYWKFRKAPGHNWKKFDCLSFQAISSSHLVDKLASTLRTIEGPDRELYDNTAESLSELTEVWQIKVELLKLKPNNYMKIKVHFWIKGADLILRKYLDVLVPPIKNPLYFEMCATEKILREITYICNDFQALVVQQHLGTPNDNPQEDNVPEYETDGEDGTNENY